MGINQLDFEWRDEPWVIRKPGDLADAFGVAPDYLSAERLAVACEALAPMDRKWRVCRRLFGIQPVFSDEADADDLRSWARKELADALGLSLPELASELELAAQVVGTAWRVPVAEPSKPPLPPLPHERAPELRLKPALSDDERLRAIGVKVSDFSPAEDGMEKRLFLQRMDELRKFLDEPTTRELAIRLMVSERTMRRMESKLAEMTELGEQWRELNAQLERERKQYGEEWRSLDEIMPFRETLLAGVKLYDSAVDFVVAYQEHEALGRTGRAAALFDEHEIEVLFQRKKQFGSVPDIRLGQMLYWIEARSAMGNREWRSKLKPNTLKKLDALGKAAVSEMAEKLGEDPVDLIAELMKD